MNEKELSRLRARAWAAEERAKDDANDAVRIADSLIARAQNAIQRRDKGGETGEITIAMEAMRSMENAAENAEMEGATAKVQALVASRAAYRCATISLQPLAEWHCEKAETAAHDAMFNLKMVRQAIAEVERHERRLEEVQ